MMNMSYIHKPFELHFVSGYHLVVYYIDECLENENLEPILLLCLTPIFACISKYTQM